MRLPVRMPVWLPVRLSVWLSVRMLAAKLDACLAGRCRAGCQAGCQSGCLLPGQLSVWLPAPEPETSLRARSLWRASAKSFRSSSIRARGGPTLLRSVAAEHPARKGNRRLGSPARTKICPEPLGIENISALRRTQTRQIPATKRAAPPFFPALTRARVRRNRRNQNCTYPKKRQQIKILIQNLNPIFNFFPDSGKNFNFFRIPEKN